MRGYRNNPAANAEVFFTHTDGERYFRTGDLGSMIEGKFLKLTGRIKEQFKLENGKFVIPGPIEDCINRSKYVAQTFIYGVNQSFPVALIVPEITEVREYASKMGLEYADDEALMQLDEVLGLLSKEILQASAPLKSYEKPLKWDYTLELFSQENHLLTPKMSMRRNNIRKMYGDQLAAIYAKGGGQLIRTNETGFNQLE